MARNTPYYDESKGGGAASAGGGGRSAGSIKREVIDTTKGSKSQKEEAAREKDLAATRRQEALDNAKTEGNKTEYPYIDPTSRGSVAKPRKEKPNLFEMTDAQRNALTPAQLRKYGSDATFKKGGYVKAADGVASRGKTKGRMI
jgi:hypothetical protein